MKKTNLVLILGMILVLASTSFAQNKDAKWGYTARDTARMKRTTLNATQYTALDLYRDTTTTTAGKFFVFAKAGRLNGLGGVLKSLTASTDSANITGGNFIVRFFWDTTGLGKLLAADNGVYQSNFTYTNSYYIGEAYVSLSGYGTAAGGATGSTGTSYPEMRYTTKTGSKTLYALVIVNGAWTPPAGGTLELIAIFDQD